MFGAVCRSALLTMYSAYQSGQLASRLAGSASRARRVQPTARRSTLANSGDEVYAVSFASTRPGRRAVISCKQPAVAVRVPERGERRVAAPLGVGSADRRKAAGPARWNTSLTSTPRSTTSACAASMSETTRKSPLAKPGTAGANPLAELNRALRAWRCELDDAEVVTDDEVGIEPPAEATVKALGALDVRNRDSDRLELHGDCPCCVGVSIAVSLRSMVLLMSTSPRSLVAVDGRCGALAAASMMTSGDLAHEPQKASSRLPIATDGARRHWAARPPFSPQDKYSLISPSGIAFSDFKGYEDWAVVSSAPADEVAQGDRRQSDHDQGVQGRRTRATVSLSRWLQDREAPVEARRRARRPPSSWMCQTSSSRLSSSKRTVKRFPKSGGWGYALFNYEAAADQFTVDPTGVSDCGHACHVKVKAKDHIFHPYQKR